MHCRWILFWLELKKFIRILPVILVETVLFAFILVGIGAYATKAIYGEKVVNEIKVGIVAEGEDKMAKMLIRFVGAMDSVKDTASFELLSEGEAKEKLKAGEIYAAVIVPEGIIDSIISGENIPAKILLGNVYSQMETEVFSQLSGAAAGLLTTAQAGIYAADALCIENGQPDKVKASEDYLNEVYLDYALKRTSFIKEKEVNALKGVNLTDYYSISLLFAFLSFAGLSFGRYMQVEMGEREKIIKSRGIGVIGQYMIETAAFSAVFALLGTILSVPVFLLIINNSRSSFTVSYSWIFVAGIWFLTGMFLRTLFQLFGNHQGGIGVNFIVLMALMLMSGVFIPQAFLPVWIEKIGTFLPYKTWMEAMAAVLQRRFYVEYAVKILWIALLSLIVGAAAAVWREETRQ